MIRWTLYRTLSARYLRQRWSRAALIVASIALGVATLVATQVLNTTMSRAAAAAGRPVDGLADFVVMNGEVGVAAELAPVVAAVPGVRSATPLILEHVVLPDLDQRSALLVGVALSVDRLADNPWGIEYRITDPLRLFQQGRQPVFVGKQLAADLSRALPEAKTLRLLAAGEAQTLPLWAGIVDAHGVAASLGGNVIYMDITAAARLVGKPGLVSRLDVALDPSADRGMVRRAIAEALGSRAVVSTPEAQDQAIHRAMSGLQIGFSVCGAGALVIGLFLVYNALAVNVTERRHEIGILRSLGATRSQVCFLFLGEAALLGLLGAALGIPFGIGLAHKGLGPMEQVFNDLFMTVNIRELAITWPVILVAGAAGLATALLAAVVPALRASAEEPAEAVRQTPPRDRLRRVLLQVACSLLLLASGAACLMLRSLLPPRLGTHGCLILLVLGMLLLVPLCAALLARGLQPLARRWLGIEGRLAADNLVRAPGRTGLVITALAAGVGMVVQTAGVIASNERVILGWLDDTIKADLFVTAGSPVGGNQTIPLKADLGRQMVEGDPRLQAALPARFRHVEYNDRKVLLIVLDGRGFFEASRPRGLVPRHEMYLRLGEPGIPRILVSENFAALYGAMAGDRLTLRAARGPLEVEVAGVVEDYSWNLGSILIDRAHYRQHFEDSLVDVFDVFLQPGADPEAARDDLLRRWGAQHALVILTRRELQGRIQEIIGRLYRIAYAQELVVGIVAALGVVTALLVSVMQRRSELGILRAIGATQGQVLRSVLAEAALMGAIGALLGVLLGVPIEWYILRIVLFEEAGFRFAVSIPWLEATAIVGVALATATLAGLGPAIQTLRLRIPEAIAYE
jgi:putative ABC transport system permease protein